jgi:phospholipase/carboxylesterase
MSDGAPVALDGPRVAPLSGKAKSLVVFLHGYGADGNDLIGLARFWAAALPDTAFVSPHAVSARADAPFGRQWFPLAGVDPALLRSGVLGAAPALDAFLDAELARWKLSDGELALVGFSQGTMMALHAGPRRKERIAGIIGYSGLVPAPEFLEAEAKHRPPVLLVHGDQDEVIPAMATYAANRVLTNLGFQVEWHIRPGLGHGIDEEGLRFGADFLRRVLP